MRRHDNTTMGGRIAAFQQTRWTIIHDAQSQSSSRRRVALGELFAIYWKPVYCYLRRRGYDNEQAKDLTQGFFQEVALGKDLFQHADRSKGRFRSFLLTALSHYAASISRRDKAKARRPASGLLQLDGVDSFTLPEPACRATPEDAFNYMWASSLLDQVLVEVNQQCLKSGKAMHWELFNARVVQPILEDIPSPSLEELCAHHALDRQKASNMIMTVKRRFQSVLKSHLEPLVRKDSDVKEEISELLKILARTGARSGG